MWTWMKGDSTYCSNGIFGVQGVPDSLNTPPGLYEACEWTDLNGDFWLYGGANLCGCRYYSVLWKYTVSSNVWTWIMGDSALNFSEPNYGMIGLPSPTNTPGFRGYGTLTWVDKNGNLWLFGGTTSNGRYADLWKYNTDINMWTWVSGSSQLNAPGYFGIKGVASTFNYPQARYETSASWTDHDNNLWLFGGARTKGLGNDLWKYNISENTWTWVTGDSAVDSQGNYGIMGIASATNEPPARCAYSKWNGKDDNLWFMGGSGFGLYNDLWKYDIASTMWSWVNGPNVVYDTGNYGELCDPLGNNYPPARFENRACWTDNNGNFWMFGGFREGSDFCFNDMWCYNPQSNQWRWVNGNDTLNNVGIYGTIGVPSINNIPRARGGALPFKDKFGNLWLFGGFIFITPNIYVTSNDLWRYVPDTSCSFNNSVQSFSASQTQLYILPNPNNGIFKIKIDGIIFKEAYCYIFDVLGRKIFFDNFSNSNSEQIDISNQTNGVYYILVNINGQQYKNKIIVNK